MRRTGFVLTAAAVLALAACGGGGGTKILSPEQSKQAVADAAQKTLAANLHVDISVTLRAASGQGAAVYAATGDLTPSLGRIDVDQRNVGGDLHHEVVARQGGHLVLYESPANIDLPKGKTWLKLDLTRYGEKRYGANTVFLAGADQDPFAALQLVTAAVTNVTDLGLQWLPDDTLNTHYRARVDVVAVAREKGVKGAKLTALSSDVGDRTQTIDVWVSKQGRIARVKVLKTLRDASTGAKLSQSSIADFNHFGERVNVSLPPARLVADYFSLVG
ncbi:MAG TPA: hypothetical protein VHD91_12265 [Gaiellaceae bacterium]|nr:hypothetical protein [Gaiellaceae bacterium]